MTTMSRFGKPNMTGLPKELGMRIFKAILSTPAPDFDKMHRESMEWEQKAMLELERQADGNK